MNKNNQDGTLKKGRFQREYEDKRDIKKYDEKRFRSMEQECANWIEKSVNNTLISCGGGFYKVKNIKKIGIVVLLDASFEWIHNRLLTAPNSKAKLKKRPLFSEPKKAKKLFNERSSDYHAVADIVINVEDKNLTDIVKEIHKKISFKIREKSEEKIAIYSY